MATDNRKARASRRTSSYCVSALLLMLAVMLLTPLSASAAVKGLQTDLTWGGTDRDRDRTVADVKDLGAGWIRLTMAWYNIETDGKGQFDFSHYDNAIEKANNSGAKILVTVYTSPPWASGTSSREAPPRDPADYADFLRVAGTRWGDKIDAWEIWNEPNLKNFWTTGPDAREYARLLKAAYPAIKHVDPTAPVLFGGTAHNDYFFLAEAYREIPNLGDYFDVMATHPYPWPFETRPEKVWYESDGSGRIAKYAFAGYRHVRKVLLSRGDDKPIWFTEFGWSTNTLEGRGVTEAEQADYLTRAYRCIEQDPYVEVAIWYMHRNPAWSKDANTWAAQLGLTYTDFSRKQSYNSFKAYTPGNTGCEYDYPDAPQAASEPQPEPVAEPSSDPDSADEPESTEDEIQTSSIRRRVGIRLVRFARATASGKTERRRRTALRVKGRVSKANRGRIQLRLTCRGRAGDHWRRSVTRRTDVSRTGRYKRRIRPRTQAACRVRARYTAGGERLSRSRRVRFKT